MIDPQAVTWFVAPAALVIAHNAAFDRKFLERYCETFSTKPWACSMSEVDWAGARYEGTTLAYLAAGAGFIYERHRATHDCMAAIELLARSHPRPNRARTAPGAGAKTIVPDMGGEFAFRSEGRAEGAGISMERRGERRAAGLVHRHR